MGKKPSDEEIAFWCELRATGLSYQQIADKSLLKFDARRSPETVRSHTKDVPVLAEGELVDEEAVLEEDISPGDVATSEEMTKTEINITNKFIAGKSKTDVIKEGEYGPRLVVRVWKFYEKEVLPDLMERLRAALKEDKVWDPEQAAEFGEDPFESAIFNMRHKMEKAESELDETNMLLKVNVGLRSETENRVDSLQEELKDTLKAFEAYKLEAQEKVDKAEKLQKEAEKEARSWTCPKCKAFYFKVKTLQSHVNQPIVLHSPKKASHEEPTS